MAGYQCEFTDKGPHAARWLHVDTETGATVALCADDNGPGMIPLLAAELGVDPSGLYAAIERYLNGERKKAEKALADAQAAEAVKDSQGPAGPASDPGQDSGSAAERAVNEVLDADERDGIQR